MVNLAPDEKSTLVMVYTMNMLVRGEVITKESARVAVWPRTQSVPNLIHMIKVNVLLFGGSPPHSSSCDEIYVPTSTMIGFHLAPPQADVLDYDPKELNRSMEPVSMIMGTFLVKGHIRMATTASLATSLEVAFNGWLSIYDAEISNAFLPQKQPLKVQLMLVSPNRINFLV
ncbi:MAG: hypothetical protein WCP19_10920 [Chloroflexota bacterium]